ncbi:nucleotidyltransferase domain-containing protein [Taibaiella soli]|uniref:Nucleotidyltransferase domain-containing protein n=1 Tax=Taibaiella soli TaxID=1649169 RepID=A0A2W2BDN3_9BACT|nr:nucleotidyltransferase domain-containing protein [Taibaiella soli]PZF74369.1 nucleotidyltransferase domain-containing protein [Taibaiella soli]
MNTTILNELAAIEAAYNIRILYACESGSRAWGFPSPDSDYDVRFIYTSPYKSYLSINDSKDHLSFPINSELDVYGWDLKKVLQLMYKSNTTPFEWLQSPMIYREEAGFRDELWSLCGAYFSQRSNIHHYLGIAKGALETLTDEGTIKIKSLFYVLRPLLSAKWCLERNGIAPMTIEPLLTLMPDKMKTMTQELIALKANAAEALMVTVNDDLLRHIKTEYNYCSTASSDLPRNQFDAEKLNDCFFKTIMRYDDTRLERKETAAP